MLRHFACISATTALIVLCTVLPCLPGPYDANAGTLSLLTQLFGVVGLVLVPVGALWLARRYWQRFSSARASKAPAMERVFPITALVVAFAVGAILTVGAFACSLSLGIAALTLWALTLWRVASRLWRRAPDAAPTASVMPFYLLIVPICVVLLQSLLAGPVTRFSRNRGIDNSAALIEDIERYRTTHGRYPVSLISEFKDYSPSIIGIDRYQYELCGEAYNVIFEQPTFTLGTREFVVYNPLDEQTFTGHAMDLLQRSPADLELMRGYYAVQDASRTHWKCFLFD